jgi:hypothetical protein
MNITLFRVVATAAAAVVFCALGARAAHAATYEVGPGKPYAAIGDVPWESLAAGDTVLIHWRSSAYKEKWVLCVQGTASAPVTVRGVVGPAGELPIIDGNGATTRAALNYWNGVRGVIKIGGANVPADTLPRHITLENLDIRSARPPYTFAAPDGSAQSYTNNAAAIYVEKGENITIRNCVMRDSGNGLFVGSSATEPSRDVLVERCAISENGNVGSIYEHNIYAAAIGMTFQDNFLGPLRAGASGNNLKDRSAGLVVRTNWIEGGNRQLDLVDGEDSGAIRSDPRYRETFVYGNTLVEPAGAGNRQIVHYGGDSGATASYRKGTLHFYNNTIVSTRTDRTTLLRLSTNDESCDARNNVFYVAAAGNTLSLVDGAGALSLSHNFFKPGRVACFGTLTGTIDDDGTSIEGPSPGFANEAGQDYRLAPTSPCIDAGTILDPATLPDNDVLRQYVKHRSSAARPRDAALDLGAYEAGSSAPANLAIATASLANATVSTAYSATVAATGGTAPYAWSIASGSLPPGLGLDAASGRISGTPTTAGTWAFTIRVTDAQNPAASATRALAIAVGAAPLAITTTSLPNARRNQTYQQTVAATGGIAPYTWSLAGGSLPPGLALAAATGVISGRPTSTGTWSFTVRVSDSQGPAAADTQVLSIRVRR